VAIDYATELVDRVATLSDVRAGIIVNDALNMLSTFVLLRELVYEYASVWILRKVRTKRGYLACMKRLVTLLSKKQLTLLYERYCM